MTSDLVSLIKRKLTAIPAEDLAQEFAEKACVAVLLRGSTLDTLEVAYIRRSISPHDRWSGQVAFPGGRKDESDEDDFATTRREVAEEVGIVLEKSEWLGHLSDLRARNQGGFLDFFIRPAVFYLDRSVGTKLDPEEVADFFWVPLEHLRDPRSRCDYEWRQGVKLPAFQMPGQRHDQPPLWGLTYMMTLDLLTRLN